MRATPAPASDEVEETSSDGDTWLSWRISVAPEFCSVSAVIADEPAGEAFAEVGARFAPWARAAGASWVLVRPDGYVYDSGAGSAALDRSLRGLGALVAAGEAAPVGA